MAGGPPSQRRVRGQLGQNRQAHCAELVLRVPELELRGAPHACLATCLRLCAGTIGVRGDGASGAIGYAVRCGVVLRECRTPIPRTEGGVVLHGHGELGPVECVALTPREAVMFVLEKQRLLDTSALALESPGAAAAAEAAGKTTNSKTKGKSKTSGSSESRRRLEGSAHRGSAVVASGLRPDARSPRGDDDAAVDSEAAGNARSARSAALEQDATALEERLISDEHHRLVTLQAAGIGAVALAHCVVVKDLLGASAPDGTADDAAEAAALATAVGVAARAVAGGPGVGGGWRVPGSVAPAAVAAANVARAALHVTTGRWEQAEFRLRKAVAVAGATAAALNPS